MERMNQSFYPSCDLLHSHSSKPSHHSDTHLLLPPPPLLHHNNAAEDASTSFSDDCSVVQGKTQDIFPSFPEMEDVLQPSDILVLDQPLRKTSSWSESGVQEPQQVTFVEGYHDQEDVMKDDYVVTSLDDPDVSQRFFAAIDNLLLQDYGNGEAAFTSPGDNSRESIKESE